MKSYLTTSTIRHLAGTHSRFYELVYAVPFDGKSKNREKFYQQVAFFLIHLEHNAIYSKKRHQGGWTPISWKFGIRKLPLLFRRRKGERKGIENLLALNISILEKRPYNRAKHLSAEFRLRPEIRSYLYGTHLDMVDVDFQSYKTLKRGFDLAKPLKGQQSYSWEREINRAVKLGLGLPKTPDTTKISRYTAARRRYVEAYALMAPNEVNLDVLLRLLWICEKTQTESHEEYRLYLTLALTAAIKGILDAGIEVVPQADDSLVARYYPKYKIGGIGGRGFEKNGGFQTLPGWVKSACSNLRNFDIVSSQASILKMLFDKHSIPHTYFEQYPTLDSMKEYLRCSKSHVKELFYGLVFNVGVHNKGEKDQLALEFRAVYGSRAVRDHWNQESSDLAQGIKLLAKKIWEEATPGPNPSWGSETGLRFVARNKSHKTKRQLLAHTIQGIESNFILELIESKKHRVCALEHDGFRGHLGIENLPINGQLAMIEKSDEVEIDGRLVNPGQYVMEVDSLQDLMKLAGKA